MPCFKLLYELWRRTNSHIEGDACAGPDILNGIRHGIAIVTVTCGQHQRVDVASVCQALANAACCGTCSGNTGDNFERNAASVERIGFLGAASEHSGVTAFEPDHTLPALGGGHQRLRYLFLRPAVTAWSLAYIDAFGVAPCQFKDFRIKQPIVIDHIRLLQALNPAQGDQVFGTGASTNKADTTALCGPELACLNRGFDQLGCLALGTAGE